MDKLIRKLTEVVKDRVGNVGGEKSEKDEGTKRYYYY